VLKLSFAVAVVGHAVLLEPLGAQVAVVVRFFILFLQ
jgi:hypothetical protein